MHPTYEVYTLQACVDIDKSLIALTPEALRRSYIEAEKHSMFIAIACKLAELCPPEERGSTSKILRYQFQVAVLVTPRPRKVNRKQKGGTSSTKS